eukprot:scaffold3134_cov414-Prasinococcus_capsulatus_cf.AAC.3
MNEPPSTRTAPAGPIGRPARNHVSTVTPPERSRDKIDSVRDTDTMSSVPSNARASPAGPATGVVA